MEISLHMTEGRDVRMANTYKWVSRLAGDMVRVKFSWLEGDRVEEWFFRGLVNQYFHFFFFSLLRVRTWEARVGNRMKMDINK